MEILDFAVLDFEPQTSLWFLAESCPSNHYTTIFFKFLKKKDFRISTCKKIKVYAILFFGKSQCEQYTWVQYSMTRKMEVKCCPTAISFRCTIFLWCKLINKCISRIADTEIPFSSLFSSILTFFRAIFKIFLEESLMKWISGKMKQIIKIKEMQGKRELPKRAFIADHTNFEKNEIKSWRGNHRLPYLLPAKQPQSNDLKQVSSVSTKDWIILSAEIHRIWNLRFPHFLYLSLYRRCHRCLHQHGSAFRTHSQIGNLQNQSSPEISDNFP